MNATASPCSFMLLCRSQQSKDHVSAAEEVTLAVSYYTLLFLSYLNLIVSKSKQMMLALAVFGCSQYLFALILEQNIMLAIRHSQSHLFCSGPMNQSCYSHPANYIQLQGVAVGLVFILDLLHNRVCHFLFWLICQSALYILLVKPGPSSYLN